MDSKVLFLLQDRVIGFSSSLPTLGGINKIQDTLPYKDSEKGKIVGLKIFKKDFKKISKIIEGNQG